MSESNNNNEQTKQQVGIQKIYTKDASFESPNTPLIFKEEWKPDVNVELSNKATKLDDDNYEVVLSITITVKVSDKIAYLSEIHQAGIFLLKGFNKQNIDEVLGSYCPGILFPFSREAAANQIQKGGFHPFYLQPIDFAAIYAQSKNQKPADSTENMTTH